MMNTFIIVVNITSFEDKSMLLVHFEKAFPLTLLGTHLKAELTYYCFILKVTRVFHIPTKAKQTEDGEHFANN